jgi:hypothetical protein
MKLDYHPSIDLPSLSSCCSWIRQTVIQKKLNNRRVGGELFVVPKVDNEAGTPIGSTTNIHISVPCFLSSTGEAVMCVIIFKSYQPVSEIPISWKLGLDITCHVDDHSKVIARGSTCTYLSKRIPCFFGTSPKASISSTVLVDMLAFFDTPRCMIAQLQIFSYFLITTIAG